MKTLTPDAISAQISALNRELADLEDDAATLALAAAEGDEEAARKIARVNTKMAQMRADRSVLFLAREAAERREAQTDEAARASDRKLHLRAARDHAETVVKAAQDVDAIFDQFRAALDRLTAAELLTWKELGLAGARPTDAIIGRRGLSTHALEKLKAIGDRREIFRNDKRSIAEIAAVAWEFLLSAPELEEVA